MNRLIHILKAVLPKQLAENPLKSSKKILMVDCMETEGDI